jgi:hypothetical protein
VKKIFKIFLVIFIFALLVFGFYLYKLHALAVEGNNIFEQRCLVVNPSLIAYKNSFLSFAEAVKNPDKFTAEQAADFYIAYFDGIRDYSPKEDSWIKTQSAYLNRWDFKLIEPWFVKEAGSYQIQMYEGYRDEAQATVDVMDGKISNDEFNKRFTDARDKRNQYTDLYNGIFDVVLPIHDWRKFFGSVPLAAGCNDANLTIPDTTGALDATPPPAENPDITG